jgi:hypothetical protein
VLVEIEQLRFTVPAKPVAAVTVTFSVLPVVAPEVSVRVPPAATVYGGLIVTFAVAAEVVNDPAVPTTYTASGLVAVADGVTVSVVLAVPPAPIVTVAGENVHVPKVEVVPIAPADPRPH